MNRHCYGYGAVLAAVLYAAVPSPAAADRGHHEARRLHRTGQILPLERILEIARNAHAGRVLEVELEKEAGRFIYELEILSQDGVVRKVYIDAGNGELLPDRDKD